MSMSPDGLKPCSGYARPAAQPLTSSASTPAEPSSAKRLSSPPPRARARSVEQRRDPPQLSPRERDVGRHAPPRARECQRDQTPLRLCRAFAHISHTRLTKDAAPVFTPRRGSEGSATLAVSTEAPLTALRGVLTGRARRETARGVGR